MGKFRATLLIYRKKKQQVYLDIDIGEASKRTRQRKKEKISPKDAGRTHDVKRKKEEKSASKKSC